MMARPGNVELLQGFMQNCEPGFMSPVWTGLEAKQAIARSKQLIQPLRAAVGLPFLGLIVVTRVLAPLKDRVLAALPMRYYSELPEIPIAVYAGFTILSVIAHRYAAMNLDVCLLQL